MPIGVIVADDHAIFRQGLASLLRAAADIALIGQAANGPEAWALIESRRPDVAILDLSMPQATGIEVARRVEAAGLDTRVVLLTDNRIPVDRSTFNARRWLPPADG
jgi:two-component system response regulator DesR